MSEAANPRASGDRIEDLLDQLAALPDRRAGVLSEELVRCLVDLYGAGLTRIVDLACGQDAPSGRELLERLAVDDVVGSLLLVHDLHPRGLQARVEEMLAELRLNLTEADVRLLHLDETSSYIKLRIVQSADSPHAGASIEQKVRDAVDAKVPELVHVEIDRLLPSTPVRLTQRPGVKVH
jgi:hypothetical protein